jgi:hypothetical protein
MRGVSVLICAGALALALSLSARASAAPFDAVERLATDKAAAVTLLKARAEREVALAAGDRLFAAYLNAATLSEGARLQPRITARLAALIGRYGIREVAVVDRSGTFLARAGNVDRTVTSLDATTNPLMLAALATAPRQASLLQSALRADLVAPVTHREQIEFVITARQDFSSYRAVLAYRTGDERFAVLTDAAGTVLADGRSGAAGGTAIVADLTLAAIRKAAPSGAGEVLGGQFRYRVSYRPVGAWTVIAVERIPAPRRCYAEGARLCG